MAVMRARFQLRRTAAVIKGVNLWRNRTIHRHMAFSHSDWYCDGGAHLKADKNLIESLLNKQHGCIPSEIEKQ